MQPVAALTLAGLLVALAGSGAAAAESGAKPKAPAPLARLTVSVSGLEPGRGAVMVALFDGRKSFPSIGGQIAGRRVAAAGATADAVFDGIPYGRYAVAVFYDRNGNGKLDMRLGMIPVEPLGFSNGAKVGTFGPPSYEAAAFDLAAKDRALRIAVR